MSGVNQAFSAERSLWAVSIILRRGIIKAKSVFLGWILRADGLHLGPGCLLRGTKSISFGANFYAHGHVWIEAVSFYRGQRFYPQIEIGDNVSISEGVHISCINHIQIARNVLIGSRTYIADHQHGIYKGSAQSHPDEPPALRSLGEGGTVNIGENAWIGDNVVIVGGVSIGRGSIIGANSVIRKDVPDGTIVVGAPARAIKRFDPVEHEWTNL